MTIEYDPLERSIPIHPRLIIALKKNKNTLKVFQALRPSLQKKNVRYISVLKSEATIDRNIIKAVAFL